MALSKTKQDLLFYSLFEETVDGIFLADEQLRIFHTDKSFRKTLKYDPNDADPIELASLFFKHEDYIALQSFFQKKKRIQNYEVELKSKTGKRIYAELNLLKNKEASGEISYMGFFHDISKRKKTEKELVDVEKRLAAGKLSRILAHEVRNPLTNVQLALEQLKDEFAEKAEEADLYFDVIKRNSERIGNLITALLNSSKPRIATLVLTDLNAVVTDALELVKDRITLKHIALNLALKEGLPLIKLDEEQIKIALVNIMVNAIEAMESHTGKLRIETKKTKKELLIEVKDNGAGITDEEANQLFEPFFSTKRKGTGLGLTTVQNIIHAHSGSISVKSTPKKGTRFIIKLPC